MNENSPTGMKASDADRDAVLSELSEHFQAGRLTHAEFDDRAGQALAARTWGELSDLLRDLPAAAGAQDRAAASSAASSARPLLPPVALAGIIIAVAVVVGVTHAWWLLFVMLLVARRCARAFRPSNPGRQLVRGHAGESASASMDVAMGPTPGLQMTQP